MADLTQDAPLRFFNSDDVRSEKWGVDSSAAQTVYKGQPMILDLNVDTVYLTPFVDAVVVAATDIFIGIAAEPFSQAISAVEGKEELQVYNNGTILGFKSAVYTDADVGDPVYMSDSGTLSATPDDNPEIGILHRVVDGFAYVQLVSPAICTGA